MKKEITGKLIKIQGSLPRNEIVKKVVGTAVYGFLHLSV